MLKALILATLTAALSGAFIATANAGPVVLTGGWGCHTCGYSNGPALDGIRPGAIRYSLRTGVAAADPAIGAVILPSGEAVVLR